MSGSGDRAFIERAIRLAIVAGGALALLFALLWLLKGALTPLALAFALAYLFDPLVRRLEQLGVGRRLAILLLLLPGLVAAALFVLVVVPAVREELVALGRDLPGYVDAVRNWVVPRLQELGLAPPETSAEIFARAREALRDVPLALVGRVAGSVAGSLVGTVGAALGLLVVPVIAFYLLAQFERVKRGLLSVVPEPYQDDVEERLATVDSLLAGFFRGQLTVCAILGVLYAAGFAAIGIPMAIGIGLAAGLLAFIPYLGNVVALTSATLLCLLEFGVDFHLALVVGYYAVVQALEGFVLTPRIVGGSVGIHPLTVIVALLIGGDLLGFLGLLVAVPAAAVVQVFVKEALAAWRASELYESGPGDAA